MHARNRGLGNGYSRSNSMGADGISPRSRISPEGSMRGRGFYNSEYRNYNRGGFGRGQRRNFHSQHSPARKGDVFVEAGRLAVEYLVSKGILPPNALSGKWQNNGLKNQVGDFLNGRSTNGESMPLSADVRPSALSRFGNAGDQGPDKKKYFDDYKKRPGSFKSYGSESNKELERSGLWSDRPKDTLNMDGEGHTSSSSKNDNQVGKDGDSGMHNSPPSEATPKSDSMGAAESAIGKSTLTEVKNEIEDSILSHTEVSEQNSLRADEKPTIESCDSKISDVEGGEIRDESNNDYEQQGDKEGKSLEPCVDKDNEDIKLDSELLRLSRFANVPTKTRSSLTKSFPMGEVKGEPQLVEEKVKIEQEHISEVKDLNMSELPDKSREQAENASVHSSSTVDLSNPTLKSNNIGSYVKEESAANEEQGIASFNVQESGKGLTTFSDKPIIKQELEGNDTVPGLQRSVSMFENRGAKRTLEDNDSWDGTKKPREQISSFGFPSDGFHQMGKRHCSEEPMISSRGEGSDQKILRDMSLFPKGDIACIEFTEEKQLFPGSYKTCDLNLMEVSELSENQNNANSTIVLPHIRDSGKQEMPINIDLSMSNKNIASERFAKCGSNGKEIEVIDLENDSLHEDKVFNCSERRSDSVFTGLDNFHSNSHNNNEVTDAQDGYGLMISELLGNDIANCSAVPPDINSLHNDMDLHSGEGILGDDDSIYMPFGEIPISFLRAWEHHPSQDYGKPF
ncbi:hypothetical protein LIER_09574 [Lithospermum erythrorhizon]|uniref:Uncharacterized protein n=1 Tax=Lithospermum erythrorhizon TaxID=34254 RepID=A0AAV3PKG4_LITER